jgi:hypothetical protein
MATVRRETGSDNLKKRTNRLVVRPFFRNFAGKQNIWYATKE